MMVYNKINQTQQLTDADLCWYWIISVNSLNTGRPVRESFHLRVTLCGHYKNQSLELKPSRIKADIHH